MKLFKRLLVAPAALGLLTPLAVSATELNINAVSEYSPSKRVQSISKFSDVYPTDWAYQALNKMAIRHGCNTAVPNSSMTRYEAAALLNKCLGNVAMANPEERRLINEFSAELAVIKGRGNDLESRGGAFEAGAFSPTTKLSGTTVFVIGAADENNVEATHFNYDMRLSLDSSFNGRDLLKTRLRSGNFPASGSSPFSNKAALETAYPTSATTDTVKVDKLYYQFPIGDDFTVTVGPELRQDDLLAVWPSSYPGDSVLDVLTYAGANGAYSLALGAGAGVTYNTGNLSTSLSFVSSDADDATKGILSTNAADDITGQIAWLGEGYTIAAVYTHSDGSGTQGAHGSDFDAYGISADWSIDADSAFIPATVSGGIGWKSPDGTDSNSDGSNVEDETTWTLGFQWTDVGVEGNTLGFGIGSAEGWRDDSDYDDPLAYEVWYQVAVSDNITITPALFVVQQNGEDNDAVTGGLVKTTFSF